MKRFWMMALSALMVCFALFACAEQGESSAAPFPQGPAWEDEIIEDNDHGEIELPEVEVP